MAQRKLGHFFEMDIKHQDIFPTRIWVADFSHMSSSYPDWIRCIEDLRLSEMKPRGKSNRLGWNSQPILMQLPEFKNLYSECVKIFNFTLKNICPSRDFKYSIEAWANINDKGGFNTLHSHPGALLSAVFYLKVPYGSGNLVFRDPRMGANFSIFQGDKTPNSSTDLTLVPKQGMLAIFPNWLEHRVEPHENDESRISIAMNVQQALLK